ncbi:hypothetical protein [Rubritepida flocculans]|uniref:hypothetical protein n=1 Tax=Rubritepida flocculans TaxID=182403 RepID=UPI00040733CC|nr:hypothetical protein [Rubritepida flocculans]
MSPSPDAAIFAALAAEAPPAPNAADLALELTEEVRALTRLLREATETLRAPPAPGSAARLAGLLAAAEETAQRQGEATLALLRQLGARRSAA